MALSGPPVDRPKQAMYAPFDDSTRKEYAKFWEGFERDARQSAYLSNQAKFTEARQRLDVASLLKEGWDTYDAEPPNPNSVTESGKILTALETHNLPPTRVMASAEGGIGISFVEGESRAEIEVFNTGEVVAATYTSQSEPVVWEIGQGQSLEAAIERIRVHLAN